MRFAPSPRKTGTVSDLNVLLEVMGTLQDHDGLFSLPGVTREVVLQYGAVPLKTIPPEEYKKIVERNRLE